MHHNHNAGERLLLRLSEGVPDRHRLRLHRCLDLKVLPSWGWSKPRFIDDYHLLYIRSGRGGYCPGGHELPFRAGRVLFEGSGVSDTAWQDPDDPPVIVSVRFGLYPSRAMTRESVEVVLSDSAQALALDPREDAGWDVLFSKLHRAHVDGCHDEAASLLHAILCDLARNGSSESRSREGLDPRIERVRIWLERHPAERLDIDAMAKLAGLSRNYFMRLFAAQVGQPAKAYQVAVRMRFARYLLEHSDVGVAQIAQDLHYPDPYCFSKQYRLYHGHPPSAVRRQ